MADGIVFGGYLLSEEDFLLVFKDWYNQRKNEFKIQLQTQIVKPLEQMLIMSSRINSKGKTVASVRRVKGQYDAAKIYAAWEYITTEFFGNGTISIIAATHFDGEQLTWTNVLQESSVVNQSGINIKPRGLAALQEQMGEMQSVYAAQDVQDFLNTHYNDLLTTLGDYTLDIKEAAAMHQLLAARKSALNNADFHFTGSTYDKIVFSSQSNAEGKRLDAFMNHVGKYNGALFSIMSIGHAFGGLLQTLPINDHGKFDKIFANTGEVQPWLVDSLNTASWLSGGDIIVVGDDGAVIYNIQLKSTGKGKVFDLAATSLLKFSKQMVSLIDAESPNELASLMYNQLKTSSANQIAQTEKFIESASYNFVRKNLGIVVNK